jgi:hypothetical protein
MSLTQRILFRARVLMGNWAHRNAFLLGLTFGASLTMLVLLIH